LGFRRSTLARLIVAGCDFRLFKSVGLLFGVVVAFFVKFLHTSCGEKKPYPGKADLEQAVATCLSSPFETELFVASQIDSRDGTTDTLVPPGVRRVLCG